MGVCAIFGHRKIDDTNFLRKKLESIFIELLNNGVETFLFGTRSNFYDICFEVLSEQMPFYKILKIQYSCKHEAAILADNKTKLEKAIALVNRKDIKLLVFDYEVNVIGNFGKRAYVVRNMKMVDDSDICLFYYQRKLSNNNNDKQKFNSGVEIIFKYAEKCKKKIVNAFEYRPL